MENFVSRFGISMSELILKAVFVLLTDDVILLLYQSKSHHQNMRVTNELRCCMSVFFAHSTFVTLFIVKNICLGMEQINGDLRKIHMYVRIPL
jgi:hypothetical protein